MLWEFLVSLTTAGLGPATAVAEVRRPGPDSQSPLSREERVREWAAADPEAFWPYWVQGKGLAWTATGIAGGEEEGLFSHDAAAGSTTWPFTLSAWVRDEATGEWIAAERTDPSRVTFALRSGFLPLPRAMIAGRSLAVTIEYLVAYAGSAFPQGVAVFRARVRNASTERRDATLAFAVRPYLVDGRVGSVRDLRFERDALWVNESFPVAPDRVPSAHPVADLECDGRDVSRRLLDGTVEVDCEPGSGELRAGAFLFSLSIGPRASESVALLVPLAPMAPVHTVVPELRRLGAQELSARAAAHWRFRLGDLPFAIPDSTVMQALRASLGYLWVAMDGELPQIGPASRGEIRAREAAYNLAALLRAGFKTGLARGIDAILRAQEPPARLASGVPGAWDAHGQAIFAAAEYVRFTGDSAFARRGWEAVRRSAESLRRLRAPMAHDSMRGTAVFGLLPPSTSPDHLAAAEGYQYWDNFWAIRGLEDAAELARIAGRSDDAEWMRAEARALRRAVRSSYRQTMLVARNDWIPAGPEDLNGSAMARSTCAGLWPTAALEPADSLVLRSFDRYWEKWVAPQGGAYRHRDRLWPYGLELGLCELLLDRPERAQAVLAWHLEHPTFPGTHAWAEQLDTLTARYAGGDMPAAWVAADYVNLVRAMLLYERGDTLVLGAGLRPEWLRSGMVEARRAPSSLGPITFRVRALDDRRRLVWEIEHAGAAGAIRLAAPVGETIADVEVDEGWTVRFAGGARSATVPPRSRRVEMGLARP